ncbi:MAG: oligosaccharide flippase family protein [Betaproteobacteria bacterium]
MTAERPGGTTPGGEMARGAAVNTAAMLASNFRGIFTFLVARLLGAAVLGTFSVAWAAMDLVSKVGTLGLDNAATTLIARAEALGEADRGRRLFLAAIGVSLAANVVVAAACTFAIRSLGVRLGGPPAVLDALAVLVWAMPGVALYRVSTAASRGRKVMRHDLYSRGLTETTATTLAFVALFALGFRTYAPEVAAVAGTGASGLVACALAASLFRRSPGRAAAATLADEARALVAYSAPIGGYQLLNAFIVRIDVIMLGWFVGRVPGVTLTSVGIYAAAVEVASGLRKVNQSFTPIFTPVVAGATAAGDVRLAAEQYRRLARWMLAILLPLVGVMTFGGGAILAIYGSAFRQGAPWLAVVAAACATNAFVGLGEIVIMVQRPALNLLNSAVTCAVGVGANLWLIPHVGMMGAAIGILLPYVLQGVLRGAELRLVFGWRGPGRGLRRPIAAAAFAAVPAAVCRLLWGDVPGQLASAALFVAAYLGAWWRLGLEEDDRATLAELTGRSAVKPAA